MDIDKRAKIKGNGNIAKVISSKKSEEVRERHVRPRLGTSDVLKSMDIRQIDLGLQQLRLQSKE